MIKNITKYMITGILGLLPIFIGLYVLHIISQGFKFVFETIVDSHTPILILFSALVSFIFIFEIGRQIQNHQQNVLITFSEKLLSKFPIIDKIIIVIKDFTDMLQGTGKFESLGVVRVAFGGCRTNGLITGVRELENGEKEYTVFIVTGTFPPTGFVCYYHENEVEIIKNMTAKDVFELQVTLGIKG